LVTRRAAFPGRAAARDGIVLWCPRLAGSDAGAVSAAAVQRRFVTLF
jgi:hypothetical protein